MKKLSLLTFIIMLAFAGVSFGQNISGSAHDFSGESWSNNQICLPCHTPHNADGVVTNAPLWNHEVTVESYDLYTGTNMNATVGQPSGISKLCLSCHDGSIALDSFGGATGVNTIASRANLGDDLSHDHPISFTYDDNLASVDGGLNVPSIAMGITGTIATDMLFSNKMECASCHDVHNGSGRGKLLVKTNAGSALCLTCHDK